MEFIEIIEKVNSDKRLVPDLMKSEKGNNFRAISESAILDVIDPILKEAGWYYTVEVKKSDLQIREAFGSKGKKLQFIATVEIKVIFHKKDMDMVTALKPVFSPSRVETESVGMGIDDNDKAMGKAYTYAVKYALLKLFRLRYGDDPDAKASEPLHTEKQRETTGVDAHEKKSHSDKKTSVSSTSKEKPLTEAQRDYILGMMSQKGITSQMVMGQFDGYDPKCDEYIPMKVARAMIKWLEGLNVDDLPF